MLVSAAFALFPPADNLCVSFCFVSAFAHISVVMIFKPKVLLGLYQIQQVCFKSHDFCTATLKM